MVHLSSLLLITNPDISGANDPASHQELFQVSVVIVSMNGCVLSDTFCIVSLSCSALMNGKASRISLALSYSYRHQCIGRTFGYTYSLLPAAAEGCGSLDVVAYFPPLVPVYPLGVPYYRLPLYNSYRAKRISGDEERDIRVKGGSGNERRPPEAYDHFRLWDNCGRRDENTKACCLYSV